MSVHTRNGHDPGHITTMLSCSEGSVDHFICLADALNGVILLVVRLTSIFFILDKDGDSNFSFSLVMSFWTYEPNVSNYEL